MATHISSELTALLHAHLHICYLRFKALDPAMTQPLLFSWSCAILGLCACVLCSPRCNSAVATIPQTPTLLLFLTADTEAKILHAINQLCV